MTKICNIRWGNDRDPEDRAICGGINVVEVMVREKTGLSEFATLVMEEAKKTMYVSPVSLFDIFDCLVCCNFADREAEEEEAACMADEVMAWDDDELEFVRTSQPFHWEAMAAADAAMKMYLGSIMEFGAGADENMENYKINCQCRPISACREYLLLEDMEECDCIHCHRVCGSYNPSVMPDPPMEI